MAIADTVVNNSSLLSYIILLLIDAKQHKVPACTFITCIEKLVNGSGHAKMCLMPYANNKSADQPAHSRSLISTFVVRRLHSIVCILAISKVSRS